MARHPYSNRIIPIALAANEVILGTHLRPSPDVGATLQVTAAASSTSWTVSTTALTTSMEAAALTTADRLNGMRIKTPQGITTITDYTAAGVITASPALRATPSVGDIQSLQPDIPILVSGLTIFNNSGNECRYNLRDENGLITAGQFSVIPNGMSRLIIDTHGGTPGFPIHIALTGAIAPATIELEIFTP